MSMCTYTLVIYKALCWHITLGDCFIRVIYRMPIVGSKSYFIMSTIYVHMPIKSSFFKFLPNVRFWPNVSRLCVSLTTAATCQDYEYIHTCTCIGYNNYDVINDNITEIQPNVGYRPEPIMPAYA